MYQHASTSKCKISKVFVRPLVTNMENYCEGFKISTGCKNYREILSSHEFNFFHKQKLYWYISIYYTMLYKENNFFDSWNFYIIVFS